MKRSLHLNLFIQSRGHHEASWRHANATELSLTDVGYYESLASKAEAGLFDSIFLADALALWDDSEFAPHNWLEPITSLAALTRSTSRIGLIATASTTYSEPYNLARQFASIDHMSNGRVGWNIVTSWSTAAAGNYGDTRQVSHAERYERAEDFMTAVYGLWDSWSDDAVLDDRASGRYADPGKFRAINHHGPYYQITGPLNIPRGPQGRPVMVQAGSSEDGRRFAARHAEAVFTAHMHKASAQAFYRDLKRLVAEHGRAPEHAVILPGLSALIGSTETEARRLADELNELANVDVGLKRLTGRFGGADFSQLPLDQPLSPDDLPDPATVEAARSRTEVIIDVVRRERPTLRQLLQKLAGARGHFTFVGTPEQLVEEMMAWFDEGAADGFNLMPPVLPWMLDVFIAEVIPLLQRRGVFREAYEGTTLRDHFGLPRPDCQFG